MKMQRSHCENENVQFVQELAEMDGPFESPININFRDLTKLELPSLVWNRAEVCPKKMKITNTGHTVIISGKWKCERPYLTGGPLSGKYVFSQIHFHWGQDDCRGSEHLVCGEGFPLEMHVAHFKTEYLTQECALREKDGMVVVVYLFKLQDEPNASLKKILNLLPCVKQASTSHALDPRPILSLCNPFTDDYFMYWGSVVTSTCAHILLWIISREPFGISREQVNEFRKILDTSHQPICRNSRDTQPLHRRNVFHVNASKHLDDPLLPIKKVLGCYCKGSETNVSSKSATNDCNCQTHLQNQEEVEGNIELAKEHHFSDTGGKHGLYWKASLPRGCFAHQSFLVQTATIHSVPTLVKRFDSEPVGNKCCLEDLKQTKSEGDTQLNPVSKSCCFFSTNKVGRIKGRTEKRKVREKKKPFNSVRAFSHLMDSLEAIKNQTFKKLKEIESINQEIKGMKPFCQDTEDKRWLRRIEKIISRQKRFTLKSSQGCFSELKKIARECNFDKFFDGKAFQVGDNNQKMMWLNGNEMGNETLPYSYNYTKGEEIPRMEMSSSKQLNVSKAIKFSSKAQRLIQSFFEDIKESDDLQETVKKDLSIKKLESLCSKQAGDSNSASLVNKGYITQKMFTLGNLGDRFFTAVSTEDFEMDDNQWPDKKQTEEIIFIKPDSQSEKVIDDRETKRLVKRDVPVSEESTSSDPRFKTEEMVSPCKDTVVVEVVKAPVEAAKSSRKGKLESKEKKKEMKELSDSGSVSNDEEMQKPYSLRESPKKSARTTRREICDLTGEKLLKELQAKIALSKLHRSSSNLSTESTETQQMLVAKIHSRQSRKDVWEQKSSGLFTRVSSKVLYEKNHKKQKLKNVNLEGYYLQKKNLKKTRSQRYERMLGKTSWDLSSTSKEAAKPAVSKSKWKRLSRAKFRLEIGNSSESTLGSVVENSLISPERKKLKLEYKRGKAVQESKYQMESKETYLKDAETRANVSYPYKYKQNEETLTKKEISMERQMKLLELNFLKRQQRTMLRDPFFRNSTKVSGNISRASTNKTFRASSADSRRSSAEDPDFKKSEQNESSSLTKTELLKKETQVSLSPKIMPKKWSLTNITTSSMLHSTEMNQRVFIETIDDRTQSSREVAELKQRIESPKKVEERQKMPAVKGLFSESSNETDKKPSEDRGQKDTNTSGNTEKSDTQTVSELEYNVRFFTTTPKQITEELLVKSRSPEGKGKSGMAKRCDAGKYHFLETGLQEANEDHRELPHRTDSNKSFTKNASKGDADKLFPTEDPLSMDNKERQGSISYSALKKTPTSRHHSAENLISLTKTMKRKSKKRPHCCKRSSRHYIRKNSSIVRKPSKMENKQLNLLNLTDEEQLKIISANVAKYLRQKLVDQDAERNCSFKDIQEVVYNNLIASQEKPKDTPLEEKSPPQETEIKTEETPAVSVTEQTEETEKMQNTEEILVVRAPDESKKGKPVPTSSKPVHNFIKRNKQLAGKYKRTISQVEKSTELKKKEEKPKSEVLKFKPRTLKTKKDKGSAQKQDDQTKSTLEGTSRQKSEKPSEKSKKGNRIKSPRTPKNQDSKNQKSRKKSEPQQEPVEREPEAGPEREPENEPGLECEPGPRPGSESEPGPEPEPKPEPEPAAAAENEEPKQLMLCTDTPRSPLPPPLPVRKIPQPKKRLVPAYMMTSYLPAPIEIVENQKRKMNKYLLSMSNTNLENYLPEVLYEAKNRKRDPKKDRKSDPIFEKELEYLIKLQMCLNEEITTNLENSMNCVKTLLSPDYPLPYYDTANKGVVLVEMKDLDCSSSGSDLTEDITKYYMGKEMRGSKSEGKIESNALDKQITCIKMPKESGDSDIINPIPFQEGQEDVNSDSSYDCKISITLNPNAKEGEGEIQSHDTFTYLEDNSNSQTTIYLGGSSSQSTVARPHRKKRKENEISMEMKKKLLEILEAEIKREIGIANGVSSEFSSEGLTMRWEDSDGNNRSQSTESSCDNIEMLTQISETMRQYLSDFKERRLEEIITESSDKESKDDESAC